MATRAVLWDHLEKVKSVQDRFQSDDNWVEFGLRVLCVWPASRLRKDELVQVSDAIVAFAGYSNEELSELSDAEIEMVDDIPGLIRQDKDRSVRQVVSSGRLTRTYSKSESAIHDTIVQSENITDTELHRWQVHLASNPKCQGSAISIPMASTVQHLQDTLLPAHVKEQLSAIAIVDTALDPADRRALGEVLFDQLTLAQDKLAQDGLVIGLRGEKMAANVGVQAFFRTLDLLDQVHSRSFILSSLLFLNASRTCAAGEDSPERGGKLSWSVSLQKESASVVELLEDCANEFVKSEEAREAL
ncbi:hypothetical protein Tdes44962_MAKER08244 [Teratosphaeria destructans]|uniref:Uncharacterized protein n=1 Tax=Teratosphaeria destructans TaxID=418781 RepID=A0A9W7SWQ1_9PEZI|nr:hypothetical protein Tdes44962_MAKER08244 [Teratosphaeria destructans]